MQQKSTAKTSASFFRSLISFRGEIAELFEQVAKEELQKSMMVGDYSRAKQMRALMVVLPYSASLKDDGNSIQELFTKAPITRVESDAKPPAVLMTPQVTQKPVTTLAFTTTTRRSTTQFAIPNDFDFATTFRPLPKYDEKMFQAMTSTEKQVQPLPKKKATATIPSDLEDILKEMKVEAINSPSNKPQGETGPVAPDVKDVLQSLGLWEEHETPMVFSKQTLSEHFAPVELDFVTGTVRTVEKPQESVNKRMQAPQITPTDFVSFKPIPKLDKAEVEFENYEYFKSLGILDSSKESRAYSKPAADVNRPIVSKKAQGFSRRKADISYEEELLKKISKQEREQLLDVLKKLESQVVAGKLGPNPLEHTEISLTKKDVKRQEATTESVEPVKFSFNFGDDKKPNDDIDDDKKTADQESTPEVLSDDLPAISLLDSSSDNEGRIVNKPGTSAEEDSKDSVTTTTITTTTTELPSSDIDPIDTETFSLPSLNTDELENQEDSGGLDPVAGAMPPPERKNGFYFLADWNSFLEVGEGKDRVEVQFKPRVGDSRLFIPVTVP